MGPYWFISLNPMRYGDKCVFPTIDKGYTVDVLSFQGGDIF